MRISFHATRRSGIPILSFLFLLALVLSAELAGQEPEPALDRAVGVYARGSFQEAFSLLSGLSERADEETKNEISDRLAMMGISEYFLKNYKNAYDALRFALTLNPTNYAGTQYFVRIRREMDVTKLENATASASPAPEAASAAPARTFLPAQSETGASVTPELESLLRLIRAERARPIVPPSKSPKDDTENREMLTLLNRIAEKQEEGMKAQAGDARRQEFGDQLKRLDERIRRIEVPYLPIALLVFSSALLSLVCGILVLFLAKGRRAATPALETSDLGSAKAVGEPRAPVLLGTAIGDFHGRIGDARGSISPKDLSAVVAGLRSALRGRDRSVLTAKLSREIAKGLGLASEEQESVYVAALAHDAGYLLLDPAELGRVLGEGELGAGDFAFIKSHAAKGLEYFREAALPTAIRDAILYHHERMDGSGYPKGLSGEDIPPIARIIGAAETFVSLLSERNYRRKLGTSEAVALIAAGAGVEYDPSVAAALTRIVDRFEAGRRST